MCGTRVTRRTEGSRPAVVLRSRDECRLAQVDPRFLNNSKTFRVISRWTFCAAPRGSAVGQKLDGERDNGAHNGQT